MKLAGGMYLWAIVIFMFFLRFAKGWRDENTYRRLPGVTP